MDSVWMQLGDDDFNSLLATILDDILPTTTPLTQSGDSSLPAVSTPAQNEPLPSFSYLEQVTQDPAPTQEVSAGASAPLVEDSKRAPKRSSSSRSGNSGMRLQKQQLEQLVLKHQQELRQQLHRRLYLTERVAILEKLIFMRDLTEDLVKEVKAGLTYNPFAVWNTDVENFKRTKPAMLKERFIAGVQSLANRLASIAPLLQKYPHLGTHRPPWDVLNQLVRELSLAEPTNPYGADGLPVGSLTVPVPENVLRMFASAYGLDLTQMSASELAMLESCTVAVVEQCCNTNAYRHAFFMLPEMHLSSSMHIHVASTNPSWEDLASQLSSLNLDNANGRRPQDDDGNTVAPEGHWKSVAASLNLTSRQKLQAALLSDIISMARRTLHAQRAQLGQRMSQLLRPSSAQQVPEPTGTTTLRALLPAAAGSQAGQTAQDVQLQGTSPRSDTGLQRSESHTRDAAALLSLSAEQLTQQEALMQRLADTLIKERLLINLTNAVMYGSMLGVIQVAQLAVYSYPFLPDHQAILAACATLCTPAVMDELVDTVNN